MRVLVTGAGGFLGQHVARIVAARVNEVLGGLRRRSAIEPVAAVVDVTDPQSVTTAFAEFKPTHVVHCAAYGVNQALNDAAQAFAVNVMGTLNVVRAAAASRVVRFVHVGSCSEYAGSNRPIPETAPQCPNNVYAATKAAGTLLALQVAGETGLPLVVVRPFGLWGPGEAAYRLVPQVIEACRSRTKLDLTPCDIVRDYTFVGDMAGWIATITADAKIGSGTIINLGSGHGIVLRDFVLSLAGLLGGAELMDFGARSHRPNEQNSLVADTQRLVSLLGAPTATSLADGVRQTIAATDAAG